LGLAYPASGLIVIDQNAADLGWQQMDLLSVVSHELGHLIGLEDDGLNLNSIMGAELRAGQSRFLIGSSSSTDSYTSSPFAEASVRDWLAARQFSSVDSNFAKLRLERVNDQLGSADEDLRRASDHDLALLSLLESNVVPRLSNKDWNERNLTDVDDEDDLTSALEEVVDELLSAFE
jgi:hypothetical protein